MRINRTAFGGVIGILAALTVAGCGGGGGYGGGGGGGMTPAAVTVTVSPTMITLGQSVTVTWTSNSGNGCTASGAWTGTQVASGSATVTPTAVGTATFSLTCSGGIYSSNSGSAALTVNAATSFTVTNLVADTAGPARKVDPALVNPWGLVIPVGTAPAWVANNGTSMSTLYDGDGIAQSHAAPIVVSFAAGFDPTGIISNTSSTDFLVTSAGKSGAGRFIFDGEAGMIAGWSPAVDATHGITMYTDAGGAVYKGLAIATQAGNSFLYATDFHNNKIDVFNNVFVKQTSSATVFTFKDPAIPAGYAPFGIQAINNGAAGATQIYVTYAQQMAPDNHDEVDGAGLGYVDIYDTNGQLVKQLIAKGVLDAPWGLALAPADFGTLSSTLLVGNFGDGKINGYDPATGIFKGAVTNSTGAAIATMGLWGIAFGNDANNQPHNTLFFTAGTNGEANGLYGRIDAGGAPTLGASPVVTLTVPSGSLSATVSLGATVVDPIGVSKVDFFAGATLIGTATTAPYSLSWNTTTVANGTVSLTATATDKDGNIGTSNPATVVTVLN
jgi:uncharacterized protein (TIGR03118 family)